MVQIRLLNKLHDLTFSLVTELMMLAQLKIVFVSLKTLFRICFDVESYSFLKFIQCNSVAFHSIVKNK